MKIKDKALEKFKYYKSFVEVQKGIKLKKLCVDEGGEFINTNFKTYLKVESMTLDIMAAYSLAQNGISE